MPVLLKQIPPEPEEIDRFLRSAALNLFADLPLPSHDLQPVGQPKQGRNDPCACGSGQKYKHCCGANAMPPLFGNMNLLRYVLDAYPKSRLVEVCASKASIDAVADRIVQRALTNLTPLEREVILLHFFNSMTLKETCETLSVPLGTVKSRLHSALTRLSTMLCRPQP